MEPKTAPSPLTVLILWVLWFSFMIGIVFINLFLGQDTASHHAVIPNEGAWFAAAIPIFISAILRWIVLPKVRDPQKLLTTMILGISTAEAVTFFGLFLFPAHRVELCILSALGIFQFIPTYARRQLGLTDSASLRE